MNLVFSGGVISPVHDGYKKSSLISSEHRLEMSRLAVSRADSWVKVSDWEVKQACNWIRILWKWHHIYHITKGSPENGEFFSHWQLMIKWVPEIMYTFSISLHIVNVYKFSGTHFIMHIILWLIRAKTIQSRVATKIFEDFGGALCKEYINHWEPVSIVHYTHG